MARILVVDDDRNIRELLALHLGSAGYEVDVAEDALAAGHILLRTWPDLIISDVNMPRIDGFTFIAALRDDIARRQIPVVLLSSAVHAERKHLDIAQYLTKPIRADTLLFIVARHIRDGLVPVG
jgi:two-component system, chemotaxis family, chemotaxis protein CheY